MKSKYKTVFLGNQNVGKTTLITQFVYGYADKKYHPTIAIDFISMPLIVNAKEVKLQLWDTAGQERFNSIIPTYTRNAFIAVIVFDLSDIKSAEKIDFWIETCLKINNSAAKLIFAGNKKDMTDQKVAEVAMEKAAKYNALYVETMALNSLEITDLVDAITDIISKDVVETRNIVDIGEDIELDGKSTKCCSLF